MPVTEPQPSESIGSDSAIWHRHDHDARVGARVGHVAHVLRKNLRFSSLHIVVMMIKAVTRTQAGFAVP